MKFTYQLEPGVAKKSFANNIAQMVRLPKKILNIATNKSE